MQPEHVTEPPLAPVPTQNWHLPGDSIDEIHCLQNPNRPTKHWASFRGSRLYEEQLVFHLGGDTFSYSRPLHLQKLHGIFSGAYLPLSSLHMSY